MKILGYTYTIVINGLHEYLGAFGRFHADDQVIQVAADLCAEQMVSTVLHEIIEATNYHLSLSLPHQTIMSLEASLYQTLTSNGVDLQPLMQELPSWESKKSQQT